MSDIGSDPKIRISENLGSGKLRSESDPKFSDRITGFSDRISGFRIGSPGFRIGSVEIFVKSRSVSDPKTRNFFQIPDPKYLKS